MGFNPLKNAFAMTLKAFWGKLDQFQNVTGVT